MYRLGKKLNSVSLNVFRRLLTVESPTQGILERIKGLDWCPEHIVSARSYYCYTGDLFLRLILTKPPPTSKQTRQNNSQFVSTSPLLYPLFCFKAYHDLLKGHVFPSILSLKPTSFFPPSSHSDFPACLSYIPASGPLHIPLSQKRCLRKRHLKLEDEDLNPGPQVIETEP